MTVRSLTAQDLPAVSELWNAVLVHDPVGADRIASISLGDPTVGPEARLVAWEGDVPAGFAFGTIRSGPETGEDDKALHLKAFAFAAGREDAGKKLLDAIEAFARRKGRRRIVLRGAANGRYVFPAPDVRYESLIALLNSSGYADLETLQDAVVDLKAWKPNAYQIERDRRCAEAGIEGQPYEPSLVGAVREFAARSEVPDWFPPGWEEAWARDPRVIVAVQEGKVLSYAQWSPGKDGGWFGPTATLPNLQGKGIGTLVLLRCMQALKASGTPSATASWVWPPEFYLKSGWSIGRRYAALEKTLQ